MGRCGIGVPAPGLGAYGSRAAVTDATPRPSPTTSTVSLCNANFSRVSLGNTSHEGASHA